MHVCWVGLRGVEMRVGWGRGRGWARGGATQMWPDKTAEAPVHACSRQEEQQGPQAAVLPAQQRRAGAATHRARDARRDAKRADGRHARAGEGAQRRRRHDAELLEHAACAWRGARSGCVCFRGLGGAVVVCCCEREHVRCATAQQAALCRQNPAGARCAVCDRAAGNLWVFACSRPGARLELQGKGALATLPPPPRAPSAEHASRATSASTTIQKRDIVMPAEGFWMEGPMVGR